MNRRTLTMNWDGLDPPDDDDQFYDSNARISAVVPLDLDLDSDDEDFVDSRINFLSAATIKKLHPVSSINISSATINNTPPTSKPPPAMAGYDMWMSEPGDITERRKRLLQGMGLTSSKNVLRLASTKITKVVSRKVDTSRIPTIKPVVHSNPSSLNPELKVDKQQEQTQTQTTQTQTPPPSDSNPTPVAIVLVRSRSDSDIDPISARTKQRKEDLLGSVSKQKITRTYSGLQIPSIAMCQYSKDVRISTNLVKKKLPENEVLTDDAFSSFFLIKNLDTGKEFIVKEYNEQGMWNKLSDVQTGKQLTMEEFEKSVGYSPIVKELMRRQSRKDGTKLIAKSFTKSFRNSKKKGAAFLKNVKGVATSMSISNKEHEHTPIPEEQKEQKEQKGTKVTSQWVKTRQYGKTHKEFTALHLSQEIHAHEGSIWTIKFSPDAKYMASAGEDKIIHVWEVQDCDVMSARTGDDLSSANSKPLHPMAGMGSERPPLIPMMSERKKKGKTNKKKGSAIPDYVHMPEMVFSLSEKPVCTFSGHQEDVLDLSWSKSQLLLSSSMDKTVRLWDLEKKNCLKMFAHNDYVTCIQFNPVDDDYFISGSLDGKVRIWNTPRRHVVDWMDIHEMVTAASYTPDGQGAVIGSHQGICHFYSIKDYKLEHLHDVEMKVKSQMKKLPGFQTQPQPKKITGFQYAPWNPSEVLITSTDSRIRIYDGQELIQKYRGFRNTSSQISAFFSPDGKYVISASEDSQVYIWKVDEAKAPNEAKKEAKAPTEAKKEAKAPAESKKKTKTAVQAYEHFTCKDVSVAIPWPGSTKIESLTVDTNSKSQSTSPSASPLHEDNNNNNSQVDQSVRKNLPPLPKKNNKLDTTPSCVEEDPTHSSPKDPRIRLGESMGSSSELNPSGDLPSISDSSTEGRSNIGESPSISASTTEGESRQSAGLGGSPSISGSNTGGGVQTIQESAWGVVIVTASMEGEIRVYQNFGLPLKVGRQTNLF